LTGNPPAVVAWKDAGMTLSAYSIEGETGGDEKSGQLFVKSATIQSNAVATLDSQAADSYALEHAKEIGAPQPPPDPEIKRLQVTSPLLTYAGDPKVGKITVPQDFNTTGFFHGSQEVTVKGTKGTRVYDDHVEAHGSSGNLEFLTHATESTPIRKGTIMGPVVFKYRRDAKIDGKAERPTTYNLTADRLDIDFLSAKHTITVTGNVRFDGESQGYKGSGSGAKAVLTFGPGGDLEGFTMEGPTETNIKPQKSGSGGR